MNLADFEVSCCGRLTNHRCFLGLEYLRQHWSWFTVVIQHLSDEIIHKPGTREMLRFNVSTANVYRVVVKLSVQEPTVWVQNTTVLNGMGALLK